MERTNKVVHFAKSVRSEIQFAVSRICEPVASTMGPGGKTVIIEDEYSHIPHVTKDGVSVAESINVENRLQNSIIQLIKEAARKNGEEVGDGTTTATVLAKALIGYGFSKMDASKVKSEFFDGMEWALERILDYLEESKVMIDKDSNLLENVVKISSNNDEEITKAIMEATKASGPDGIINVEPSEIPGISIDVNDGASMTSASYFKGKTWEREKVLTVLVNGAIREMYQIESVLRLASQQKRPVMIIAKEFTDKVKNAVMINNNRGSLDVCLTESEGFGQARLEILEDLQFLLGGKLMSSNGETQTSVKDFIGSYAGQATKVIVSQKESIIFTELTGSEAAIERRDELQKEFNELKGALTTIESARLQNIKRRLSKFSAVATIHVGGYTKAEAKERYDRVEDAVCAVSSAFNGGVLPGGGASLYRAAWELSSSDYKGSDSFKNGVQVVLHGCEAPFNTLCHNLGIEVNKYNKLLKEENVVIDLACPDPLVGDAFKLGILDPAEVTICALNNAYSVSKSIINSSTIITIND